VTIAVAHLRRKSGNTFLALLILLLCCLLAYWPLTFHVFSLKNDALNYFLPVRYQISEAIHFGYWPFWSPYFNLGYPLHGDMQSGVWNPFVLIFSLFGPYTLKTLQYETLLYIYLSGMGMYFLAKFFFKDWRIALLSGAAFMLCGFNSDSSQFLNWISSASFLPFVFLFYYRTITECHWKMAICSGVFLYLLFSTAYPADFILTAYLLVFVFCWYVFQKNNRHKKNLWPQLKLHFLMISCFLLLSAPAIISYTEFLPLTQRGTGASYKEVMSNPFHPFLLLSYLTPLTVWKAPFAALTDPLERNSFFGLITVALFLLSFFLKTDRRIIRFFKWAFVVSLIFSFGELGGLRIITYYLLPLMKAFRHPANAKIFTIFFACLLAGFSLQQVLKTTIKNSVKKYIWYILLLSFIGLLFWSLTNPISIFSSHLSGNAGAIKIYLDRLGFSDILFINIMIQLPFLIMIYYWLIRKINLKWLLPAALLNSIIHTILFQPFTVIKKDTVTEIQKLLDTVQKPGYPIPDLNATLVSNSNSGMDFFKEIGTLNMYNKKIGRVAYRITPSNLLKQNEFWFNEKIRNILFQYPIFYKADTIIAIADTSKMPLPEKKIILSERNIPGNFSNNAAYSATVKKFTPLEWNIEIKSNDQGYYCLFQNYYPRWQLFIDGKKEIPDRCNISFIGFKLSPGRHFVSLRYKTADLKFAFLLSSISLVLIFVCLFSTGTRSSFISINSSDNQAT